MKVKFQIKVFILLYFCLWGYANAQTLDWSVKANPIGNSINGVTFRADGQQILSGTNCHPASIRIYDVGTGSMQWDYEVPNNYMCIMGVSFSSNANYIAAIEEFGNVFIFDNTTALPTIKQIINTGTSYGFSTTISPANDKVAVGCSNGKLKVYNLSDGTLAQDVNAHLSWVTTVAYSPDGNVLISGGNDNLVKIWSNTGSLLFSCTGHLGAITNVKVSPDNKYAISSSKDDKIKVWDIASGALVRTLSGHSGDVNGLDFSPNGTMIVSGSSDKMCKIWDFNTGTSIATFGVPDSGIVNTVAWSPNGVKVVTGNERSDVMLWDISSITEINHHGFSSHLEIYPNPAIDKVRIKFSYVTRSNLIQIYDLSGQLQKEERVEDFTSYELDTSDLNKGMYFLSIETEAGIFSTKLIVQ